MENFTQAQFSARMRIAAKAVAMVAQKTRKELREKQAQITDNLKYPARSAFDWWGRPNYYQDREKYGKQIITVCSSEIGKPYGYIFYDQDKKCDENARIQKKLEAMERSASEEMFLNQVLNEMEPRYKTPLAQVTSSLVKDIQLLENKLRCKEQQVVVVVATDGLPDDTELFLKSIDALEKLPVLLNIRLFTSDPKVINFWNSLDLDFQSNINILQDYITTAKNVQSVNKWAMYTMSLHRCREWGFHCKLMHIIDEAPLSHMQVRDYCSMLFDIDAKNLPNPISQWKNFYKVIEAKLNLLPKQWSPLTGTMVTWIDLKAMDEIYGERKHDIPKPNKGEAEKKAGNTSFFSRCTFRNIFSEVIRRFCY